MRRAAFLGVLVALLFLSGSSLLSADAKLKDGINAYVKAHKTLRNASLIKEKDGLDWPEGTSWEDALKKDDEAFKQLEALGAQ